MMPKNGNRKTDTTIAVSKAAVSGNFLICQMNGRSPTGSLPSISSHSVLSIPEQAVNWDWCAQKIQAAREKDPGRELKVLNLFAYTGGATISAANAGANVTHVDASKGMVTWAKENAVSSNIPGDKIRWLVDDCAKFVEREIRRGNTYDGIIMDPPSYGRGPKGEIWKIEESIFPFIELTSKVLSKDPVFFLINSYTTGLQPAVLSYMLNTVLTKKLGGCVAADEIGLPVTRSGLVLPCGASGRWSMDA